jgi:uncharacterized protein
MPRDTTGNLRAAALLLTCLALPAIADTPAAAPSSIRVTGDARVSVKPDRVQIDIGVSTHAASAQEAATQNARQAEAMLAALRKAAGAGASLKTLSYSLSPTWQYHPNGAEPTLSGYAAANLVQVTLDELARLGAVIDAATSAGANQVQGVQFTLREEDAVRAEALRQAAQGARAKAEVLAGALGLKIERVLSVEENSPRLVPVRTMMSGAPRAAAAAATPVEAGTLEVTADVVLTVEVAPAARPASGGQS